MIPCSFTASLTNNDERQLGIMIYPNVLLYTLNVIFACQLHLSKTGRKSIWTFFSFSIKALREITSSLIEISQCKNNTYFSVGRKYMNIIECSPFVFCYIRSKWSPGKISQCLQYSLYYQFIYYQYKALINVLSSQVKAEQMRSQPQSPTV